MSTTSGPWWLPLGDPPAAFVDGLDWFSDLFFSLLLPLYVLWFLGAGVWRAIWANAAAALLAGDLLRFSFCLCFAYLGAVFGAGLVFHPWALLAQKALLLFNLIVLSLVLTPPPPSW
jgi:hypothetical protein